MAGADFLLRDSGCTGISRRRLLTGFVLAWAPLGAAAQEYKAGKVQRIGVPSPGSVAGVGGIGAQEFVQRLRELGWSVGQNLLVEARYAEGKLDRLPTLATGLAQLQVSVILAFGTPASLAAKHATATIPIVVMAGDPVGTGLVASLARPGGNITGVTIEASLDLTQVGIKRLELLKEAAPKTQRLGILWNTANPAAAAIREAALASARALGVTPIPVEMRTPDDLGSAFTTLSRERVDALTAADDPPIVEQRRLIIDFATQNRLPTVFGVRAFVDAGGLMSYGTDWVDVLRRAATFVDKILRGARPGDLPVEQPAKFELVINLKTARALGLPIPQSLLQRADQVIE